jgi:hypothetical protein
VSKDLFDSYREALLDNGVDVISGNVKICALSAGYVVDLATHNFHDDLTNIVATSGNLASKTGADGYFDAASVSLGSPAGGSTITQLVLWRDSGVSGTSELIAWTDEDASGAPISIATNGEAITVTIPTAFYRV